jgi:hypothetical protein
VTNALQFKGSYASRRIVFAWRQGNLAVGGVIVAIFALLLLLAISAWQDLRFQNRIDDLGQHAARLQAALASRPAAVQAALPPDVVQTLPDAPAVSQVMQTLQQAADKEGARVESLQADDHPPTATALGRLNLVVSIKAPYPATLVVLQQVLDRYPGATLKQMDLALVPAPATAGAMVAAPIGSPAAPTSATPSETRVQLSFWGRPQGVEQARVPPPPASGARPTSGLSASSLAASAVAKAPSAAAPAARPNLGVR